MATIVVGCDFHASFQQIAMCNSETGELIERRLEHPREAEEFYRGLPAGARVGIETGHPSFWFERLLKSCGHELAVGHAAEIRRRGKPGHKNDVTDAALILDLLLSGDRFPTVWWPDESVRERRQLVLLRHGLVKARSRYLLQLRAIGRSHGVVSRARGLTAVYRAELEALPLGPNTAQRRNVLLRFVDQVTEEINQVTPQIQALAEQDPVSRLLLTHPGVGPVTAVYLPLVIGDPHRFKTGRAFAHYLGLVPSEYQSADRRHQGGIIKQGNRLARWLLVEAGRSAAQYDPDLQRFYRRVAQRKGRPKAMVAVARKLAIRLLLMWKRGKDYRQWLADAPLACRQARRGAPAFQG